MPRLVTTDAQMLARPVPPTTLQDYAPVDEVGEFEPDAAAWEWMRATFVEDGAALANAEHRHLRFAHVGILWTNVSNRRQMRAVLGQAEMPMARGGKWAMARHDLQLRGWFGRLPDFLITLSAPYAAEADDASFCALVEHEMLHCAQARTSYGVPRFGRDGRPIFAMRGHDVGEFTSIIARYGSVAAGVSDMIEAAQHSPTVAAASIAGACGNCLARAA